MCIASSQVFNLYLQPLSYEKANLSAIYVGSTCPADFAHRFLLMQAKHFRKCGRTEHLSICNLLEEATHRLWVYMLLEYDLAVQNACAVKNTMRNTNHDFLVHFLSV